jgi:hypothetical protein
MGFGGKRTKVAAPVAPLPEMVPSEAELADKRRREVEAAANVERSGRGGGAQSTQVTGPVSPAPPPVPAMDLKGKGRKVK